MHTLTIKAAASLIGIKEHTLRAWEKRYQAIVPERTKSGYRIYTSENFERLKTLNVLVKRGYLIGNIAKMSNKSLRNLLIESDQSGGVKFDAADMNFQARCVIFSASEENRKKEKNNIQNRILFTLRSFQINQLNQLLIHARAQLNPIEFVLQVLSPLFRELGSLVERGVLRISHEHILSAIIRDHIHHISRSLETNRIRRPLPAVLVLATPEGEFHEFGILLSSLISSYWGIQNYYLGPNLPVAELVYIAKTFRATSVVLGTTSIPEDILLIPLNHCIFHLNEFLPPSCEIWVGGEGKLNLSSFSSNRRIRRFSSLDHFNRTLEKIAFL